HAKVLGALAEIAKGRLDNRWQKARFIVLHGFRVFTVSAKSLGISKGRRLATHCEQPRPEVIFADNPEPTGIDRSSVPLHRGHQRRNSPPIELAVGEELRQADSLEIAFVEHLLALPRSG